MMHQQKQKKGEEGLFAFPVFHIITLHFLPLGGQQEFLRDFPGIMEKDMIR